MEASIMGPRSFTFAAVTACLLHAATAAAYVRTVNKSGVPVFWDRGEIEVVVQVGEPPPGLSSRDVAQSAMAAADAWNAMAGPCSPMVLRLRFDLEAEGPAADDGVSRIIFRRGQWCRVPREVGEACHAHEALAFTHVFSTVDGHIRDADIEVNAVDFAWAASSPPASPASPLQDLQYTLTHELGHLLGFDHSCTTGAAATATDDRGWPVPACSAANASVRASVLYPAARSFPGPRVITDDDARGLCAVYQAPPAELEALPGGCSLVPPSHLTARAGPGLCFVAAVALGLFIRRRRRRSAPSG
jgi:hypothetical protein